ARLLDEGDDLDLLGSGISALSDQTVRGKLRPAAALVFGQQPSFFQENTKGDAATGHPNHGVEGLTRCENDRHARLV
ncbi:MAG: hypothetical protein ABI906_04415, partial [Pseudomonadota bacterium]